MTDDELLASAFRKILKPGPNYVYVSGDGEHPHVTLDDTWTAKDDGLTVEEVAAMRRAAS